MADGEMERHEPDGLATQWADGELESVTACPVCGVVARYEGGLGGLRDYLENVPGEWRACSCHGCGSIYLAVRPTVSAIGKAYASYYTHGDARALDEADNGHSLRWKLVNGYLNRRFGAGRGPALAAGGWLIPLLAPLRLQLTFFFRHLPPKAGALLDIGCGNGVFLLRARRAGWDVAGLDVDPQACLAARKAGLDVRQGTIESLPAEERFDVVTASHVLEHVHSPSRFLQHIQFHMKPGAVLWIATPNAQSIGRRWFGKFWRGLEPPRHIVIFSRRALERSLKEAGYVDIVFHRRGRGAGYILRSSQAISRSTGEAVRALPALVVDLLASLSSLWGEELVVTARKPV